jgi:ABC-2 type transport system permease protein
VIGFAKSITRILGLTLKELRDLVRQPGAIVSLIVGPLAIMALFGLGYEGVRKPFETVIVLPANSQLPHDAKAYEEVSLLDIQIVGITEDLTAAEAQLQRRDIRLLVIVPADAEDKFRAGQQATLRVEWNAIDPIEDNLARGTTQLLLGQLNAKLIATVAGEGMRMASLPDKIVSPDVIARPLKAQTQNRAPVPPTVLFFFTPAVFALVLQHLAVTLTALALVRERLSGAIDLFRVAPVRAWEILLGKYLAYGLLSSVVAATVAFLMVRGLGVPLLGSPERLATVVILLTFASLGAGLLISLVADSERQAVQLAMLLLIMSVFFSGFVLPVDEFKSVAQYVSYALPVTYGIQLMQEIMLRGERGDAGFLLALGLMGIALYAIDTLRLRQVMRRAS